MGKGDQRSRRGKIHRGTFGKRRPKPQLHKHAAAESSSSGETPLAKEKKEPKVVKKQSKE
jgi:30S ribosomal protein S31